MLRPGKFDLLFLGQPVIHAVAAGGHIAVEAAVDETRSLRFDGIVGGQ